MQTLVGGRRDGGNAAIGEVDRLGGKAADAVHQQTHAALAAHRRQRLQVVQAAGGGLVMNHRHMRKTFAGIEPCGDPLEVGRLHPVMLQRLMRDTVLAGDLRDALAVHTVFDHQQLAALRHQRSDHAFDRGRARTGHQHGLPFGGVELVDVQETRARFFLQIEELALAMAQVGLQQTLPHALRQCHRTGIEQQHHWAP